MEDGGILALGVDVGLFRVSLAVSVCLSLGMGGEIALLGEGGCGEAGGRCPVGFPLEDGGGTLEKRKTVRF